MIKGTTRPNRRQLSDAQVERAREMLREGKTYKEIAEHFVVSPTTIKLWTGSICNRRRKLSSRINRTVCEVCNVNYISHDRCKYCTRLIHSPRIGICKWCEATESVGQCILCDIDNKATQQGECKDVDNSDKEWSSVDPVGRGN